MANLNCSKCGEDFSDTYRKCPFCQEEAALKKGKPIHRKGKRLDKSKRSGGAGGIMLLLAVIVVFGVVGYMFFGEQVANFASTVAEKLRSQNSVAGELCVFAYTNRFKENEPQMYGNRLVQFSTPTNDQRTVVTSSVSALRELFGRGYGYKKAGVVATHIMPVQNVMRSLFEDTVSVEKEQKLTSVVDAVNKAFGRGTVKLAVQGSGKIKSSSEKQSPHYTTEWSDIPVVTVK